MTQADDGASEADTQAAQPTPADLEAALSAADLEWRALAPDDDAFTVDGVRPRYLCTPATVDELSGAVRVAGQAGVTVIPWGGGTRMSLGFPPRSADLVVQTTKLREIVEYEPADLTVTVQAGMPLADLQERLRAEGQMLALDPAAADRATIGGLIAANASGPLRLLYGTARDLVIGTRVVNADGVISKAGGRVVKNVAGYDLNKLYVGSLGTVGVIVELSFKLHPLPQAQGMLLASFPSAADAAQAISTLMRSPLGPAAVELLDAGAAARACRAARPSRATASCSSSPPPASRRPSSASCTTSASSAPAPPSAPRSARPGRSTASGPPSASYRTPRSRASRSSSSPFRHRAAPSPRPPRGTPPARPASRPPPRPTPAAASSTSSSSPAPGTPSRSAA